MLLPLSASCQEHYGAVKNLPLCTKKSDNILLDGEIYAACFKREGELC